RRRREAGGRGREAQGRGEAGGGAERLTPRRPRVQAQGRARARGGEGRRRRRPAHAPGGMEAARPPRTHYTSPMGIEADSMQHLPACGYRRLRWRNGLGWTREVYVAARAGADGDDWDWRLSIAEIEADARYSVFPGVEREQVL